MSATVEAKADVAATDAPRPGLVARALLQPIRFYRKFIGPALPPSCRFEPSCSADAAEAITTHGAVGGLWLAVRRLLKCGPWHRGGYDPVPPRRGDAAPNPGTIPAHPTPVEE